MDVSSVLDSIAEDLGDNEPGRLFSRWSREQILGYLNEGLCLIGSFNPGMRSKPTLLKLSQGSEQTLGCCNRLSNVIGQVDANGNVVAKLSKSSLTTTLRWTKKSCLPPVKNGAEFRLKTYTNSATDSGFFTVDPPVPAGTDVWLKVVCSRTDGAYTEAGQLDETDCANLVAAKFWVIFRAHFVDDEKSPEYQKAMTAAKMYFQILGMKFKAEMLYELGYLPVAKQTNLVDVSS